VLRIAGDVLEKRVMDQRFSEQSVKKVQDEILRAGGNEVLFFGWTDDQQMIIHIEVVARGDEECVTVPLERTAIPDVIIHNHPTGALTPSNPDMRIAHFSAQRGVGFLIINNDLSDFYVVVEPVIKKRETKLDHAELNALISAGGVFSRTIPGFEERAGQQRMLESVCETFNENNIALIEAGTGIGKTLAYLIPSVEWSLKNRERVVISTNTINLQEQLLYKDIPDLKDALNEDFSYILMKGRGNYVCLSRVSEVQQDLFTLLDEEEHDQFDRIKEWMNTTSDGSLSDLSFMPALSLWEKINSQSETCTGAGCAYFSRCFLNTVKRRAVSANIIITNHHYLLADASLIGSGNSILPAYERLVIDEAHNLEDSATSFFTRKISLGSVLRLLNSLVVVKKKKRGYLVFLMNKGLGEKTKISEMINEVSALRTLSFSLFEGIDEFVDSNSTRLHRDALINGNTVMELSDETRCFPGWETLVVSGLGTFYRGCERLIEHLSDLNSHIEEGVEEQTKKQLDGFISRIHEISHTIDIFFGDDTGEYIRWIEKRKETAIVVSLVDVGSVLEELIFRRLKSGVFTSATLTVNNTFDFIQKRLCLHRAVHKQRIRSSFDYEEQMAVLVPSDIPGPEAPGYEKMVVESIAKILEKTNGKAFVLFTSYRMLNTVHEGVKKHLEKRGLVLFKQGSDLRKNLFQNFKMNIHSVLFGTVSFWEGVDAPGETLECVIITKLPFKVPTEPVVRARVERIQKTGGNPFVEYILPLAVIKMKQGIGRLIRKKTDTGIVVILDSRVLKRNYGQVFINSLPGGRVLVGELSELLDQTDRYLSNNSLTNEMK
jgi:ATP-dependent DNA helicase DinG